MLLELKCSGALLGPPSSNYMQYSRNENIQIVERISEYVLTDKLKLTFIFRNIKF